MRLLVVEDDLELGPLLKKDLEKAGYAVDLVDNGLDAEIMGNIEPYDAAVLDIGLPKRSGLEVLQHWREQKNPLAVIILTARDAWHERVDGLKAGADDYLGKPFHVEELIARLNALIKRINQQPNTILCVNGVCLDEDHQRVTSITGKTFELTATEYRLLRYFMLNPNKILSKSRLTEHVYELDADKDSNVIEVYVKRLRQMLGKDVIKTKRGQGYLFVG